MGCSGINALQIPGIDYLLISNFRLKKSGATAGTPVCALESPGKLEEKKKMHPVLESPIGAYKIVKLLVLKVF